MSVLEWNHQLLTVIAAGQRTRPAQSVLDDNRDVLLEIAAGDDAGPRRLARILLATSWPVTTVRWLAGRLADGSADPDDAVHLVNLLPVVDRGLGYRPSGPGRATEPVAITYDAPDVLAPATWQELRAAALATIDAGRPRLPQADVEAVLERLGSHDPLALAAWLVAPSPADGDSERLAQTMRHRHRLLTMPAVARGPETVAALEDAIAADLAIDHPRLRILALQYLRQRAPQRLLQVGLDTLPGLLDESPAGATALVNVLIQSQIALEQLPQPDDGIAAVDVSVLVDPLQRAERSVRQAWIAFLWDRRPSALLQMIAGLVTSRQDLFDLMALGDLVAQRRSWSADDELTALAALVHASRSSATEHQLLALRVLGEWSTGRARAALQERLADGDLPPAAVTLVQLALDRSTPEREE